MCADGVEFKEINSISSYEIERHKSSDESYLSRRRMMVGNLQSLSEITINFNSFFMTLAGILSFTYYVNYGF